MGTNEGELEKSDVSAVLLTTGEEFTERAVDSIRRQSLPCHQIIRVDESIRPFHRALNHGAARVKTNFFVQVDADMILDEFCFRDLRSNMKTGVGITSGALRDPMLGRINCVKMFRRVLFDLEQTPDSICPDTDFSQNIANHGLPHLHVLRFRGEAHTWHTFGEHRPDYTPQYTFKKFLIAGMRMRFRRNIRGLIHVFSRLHRATGIIPLLGQIAMARGMFIDEKRDRLHPSPAHHEADLLYQFLEGADRDDEKATKIEPLLAGSPGEIFASFFQLGGELGRSNRGTIFRHIMDALGNSEHKFGWMAKTGLCRGLLPDREPKGDIAKENESFLEWTDQAIAQDRMLGSS